MKDKMLSEAGRASVSSLVYVDVLVNVCIVMSLWGKEKEKKEKD